MQSIESTLDTAIDDKTKLAAIKVALEADKRNVEYLRLVVPRKVEHYNPDTKTSEELAADIRDALERMNHDMRLKLSINGRTDKGTGSETK